MFHGDFGSCFSALLVLCVFGSCLSALLVSWGLWVLFEHIARFMAPMGLVGTNCLRLGVFGSCFERTTCFMGSLGLV